MKLNKTIYKEARNYPEKIVQFGEGNFLRAFADWTIDKMNKEANFNSGVVVIQPLQGGLIDKLNDQDGLYTLYLNGIKDGEVVSEHAVIDCVTRGINTYTNYDEYLAVAENPELRFMISNTTEAGITYNEQDRLEDRPQASFPGKLTALLYHRFKTFNGSKDKGLVFIPCELIEKNGEKLKETVLKLAALWNLENDFKVWIDEANTFCNSLVDRIVPGYPKERMEEIRQELGYDDDLVVEGEPFHLWVIEGPAWVKEAFPAHKVGLNVLVVDDMTPYRTRKVRILNGAHTSMVPVAYLYGIDTVRESVEDSVVGQFIKETIFEEIIPTLDLPREELDGFANDVLDRFRNPFIKHQLMSISLNSMSKFETRVLPSILEYENRKGELPKKLTFSLAALIAFYKGERNGEKIALTDDAAILEQYKTLWKAYEGKEDQLKHIVTTILSNEKIWKMDLNQISGLTDMVTNYLSKIQEHGVKNVLQRMMK
ncbi:Mannitol dehydrogenase, C-terminal domain [Alkaliphilus metalliredigens QYMF]|uniref:Altronate oxidoreductase n=1 Tax=Alkaliphilus metalliredigens (strain QYMF) TaxID=293826 RepID=A6TKR4_ALKMQ|nr:tagaturonate reductase [Alkaliphilus metalliredigens]ABR46782.1 Mannitol dehydrogenase, C-terminal domain [Alkaliphilus metalliredigens QYMF]